MSTPIASAAMPSAFSPQLLDAINEVTQPNTSASSTSTSSTSTAADLQNNFMTLLVTQLQNQDPMQPLSDAQMTSQLAEIDTVSGLQDLNSTLNSITGQINASQALNAANLVGQGVLIPGNKVLVGKNSTATPLGFNLSGAADDVKITISGADGKAVKSFDLGAQQAGVESFSWDGTNNAGTPVAEGGYTFTVTATQGGKSVAASPLDYGQVTGVTSSPNGPLLDLGGTTAPVGLDQVAQIL